MKYSCIQEENYNFTIDYRDNHVIYTDQSTWLGQSDPDTAYTVKIYNGETFKEFKVLPNRSIIIPHTELPYHCSNSIKCNFDGIYKFQAISCKGNQVFERTEAILVSIQKTYDTLIKKTIAECDKDLSSVTEIFAYIKGIEAYSRDNNTEKASELYNLLLKVLKKIKCKCDD